MEVPVSAPDGRPNIAVMIFPAVESWTTSIENGTTSEATPTAPRTERSASRSVRKSPSVWMPLPRSGIAGTSITRTSEATVARAKRMPSAPARATEPVVLSSVAAQT